MAVLMAKSERVRLAYSDYKHLSTDNLSFVAGLRGRPPPPPPSSSLLGNKPRRPKAAALTEPDDNDEEIDDSDASFSEETPAPRQACPGRSCSSRSNILETMVERRAAMQASVHKAHLKLASARDKSLDAEVKLEDAKVELVRMTKSVAEGEDRMESIHNTLRDEGSVNKACADELDILLKEAMSLHKVFTADTLPPHPTESDSTAKTISFGEGGSIQPPVPSLGQEQARSRRGGSEWVHSGQLGHTQVFIRPPRQSRARSGGGTVLASSTGNGKRSSAAIIRDRGASLADKTGSATPRATAGERGYNRLEGEDAWSCCGRTVASAGWGCGPRGPLATPEDLLLDTIDPRSRLGRPLDFRDFLPTIAWMGLSPHPIDLFAGSPSEGNLRPHTAPERLPTGQGEHESTALSTVGIRKGARGGLVNRWGGTFPESRTSIWWRNENTTIVASQQRGGAEVSPKRHDYLRRSSPTRVGRPFSRRRNSTVSHRQRGREGALLRSSLGGLSKATVSNKNSKNDIDESEFLPRTQIIGMNGGRLPREVRQAPLGRPLTAPCGKLGRQAVHTCGI